MANVNVTRAFADDLPKQLLPISAPDAVSQSNPERNSHSLSALFIVKLL